MSGAGYFALLAGGAPSRAGTRGSDVGHEFVDRLLAGPGDAAEQGFLNLVVGEIGVGVALHPDEGASGLAAGDGVFVRPDLRHDFVLVVAGAARGGILAVASTWMPGSFAHVMREEGLVGNGDVGHVLHDGVRFVHDGVVDGRVQGVVHFPVLLGAAHERRKIGGVRTAQRVVKTDQAAAAFDESIEHGLLAIVQVSRIAFVDHHDVGVFQVGAAWRMQSAIDDGAMLGQNLAPIGEELRVIVLALAV